MPKNIMLAVNLPGGLTKFFEEQPGALEKLEAAIAIASDGPVGALVAMAAAHLAAHIVSVNASPVVALDTIRCAEAVGASLIDAVESGAFVGKEGEEHAN